MEQKSELIYIASPYSKGDVAFNVKRQHDCFEAIANMGKMPYAPLLSHYQHLHYQRNYSFWINHSLEILKFCPHLIRLPGESNGADLEVEKAKGWGIVVMEDWDQVRKFFDTDEYKSYQVNMLKEVWRRKYEHVVY